MKRFLVFGFDQYYPAGGWDDLRGSFDTLQAAQEHARALRIDWWQIVDGTTGKVVEEN